MTGADAPAGSRGCWGPAEPAGAGHGDARVVVAHRHRLMAEALQRLLADLGVTVMATVHDRAALLAGLPDAVVDTLVLDAELDRAGGTIALLADVHATAPNTSIVLLAERLDDELALLAEEGDLDGVVLVSDAGTGLATAIQQVGAQHVVFPAGWLTHAQRAAAANPLAQLTARQREVLHLLAQGMHNEEIAARLYISPNTVKTHIRTIYQALGVHNRVEAARVLAGGRSPARRSAPRTF